MFLLSYDVRLNNRHCVRGTRARSAYEAKQSQRLWDCVVSLRSTRCGHIMGNLPDIISLSQMFIKTLSSGLMQSQTHPCEISP